jgi:hypothetical protein
MLVDRSVLPVRGKGVRLAYFQNHVCLNQFILQGTKRFTAGAVDEPGRCAATANAIFRKKMSSRTHRVTQYSVGEVLVISKQGNKVPERRSVLRHSDIELPGRRSGAYRHKIPLATPMRPRALSSTWAPHWHFF